MAARPSPHVSWRRGSDPARRGATSVSCVVLEDHLEDAPRFVVPVHVRVAEAELVERLGVEPEARELVQHLHVAARGALVLVALPVEVADPGHRARRGSVRSSFQSASASRVSGGRRVARLSAGRGRRAPGASRVLVAVGRAALLRVAEGGAVDRVGHLLVLGVQLREVPVVGERLVPALLLEVRVGELPARPRPRTPLYG